MGNAPSTWFRLSPKPATGISCNTDGVFVGDIPLLERVREPNGSERWQPRCKLELNSDLSKQYGLPIGIDCKITALAAIGRALDRGDLALAQIATLHLQIPDPPPLAKSLQPPHAIVQLALRLQASGLLKANWNPDKHPRWPAGSPDGAGGEFAPMGSGTGSTRPNEPTARLIPAQFAMPAPPMEIPVPRVGPLPFEIVPPPLAVPQTNPKELPKNPYPKDPKCVEEWAEADEFCHELAKKKKLGRGDDGRNRGFGEWIHQCIMGRVSQECGGSKTNTFEVVA